MDLLCPNCLKRVTIPDERAGQVVNCPLCTRAFGAPALSPPAVAPPPVDAPNPIPPPPASVGETYGVSPPPPPPPPVHLPVQTSFTEKPALKPAPPPPPPPPLPPGEYTRTATLHLRTDVLTWLVPACLTLIFVLSFLPWHVPYLNVRGLGDFGLPDVAAAPANLWQLAFTDRGSGLFLAYLLLTLLLAWPLSVAALLLARGVFAAPPALRPWLPWRLPVVCGLLALGLVLLGFDYLHQHFYHPVNQIAIAMKLAARLQALALILAVLDLWLSFRARRNLPLPRAELRW